VLAATEKNREREREREREEGTGDSVDDDTILEPFRCRHTIDGA